VKKIKKNSVFQDLVGWHMILEELKIKKFAIEELSTHFYNGTLSLFLGAGVTKDFGLPNWNMLITRMYEKSGLGKIPHTTNAESLQHCADKVRELYKQEDDFKKLLIDCLYEKITLSSVLKSNNKLLPSIGTLLMGNRQGKIQRVMTLNFDCILEWYLSSYGYQVRVIHTLPSLEGLEDVRLYHPHGFLPHPSLNYISASAGEPILGFNSVNKRIANTDDKWSIFTRHLIESSLCIFIGLSEETFNDRSFFPIVKRANEEIIENRPTGFWLFKEGEISSENQISMENEKIVPLNFSKFDDIAEFLTKICNRNNRIIF
jgi:hypothetical protein